MVFSGRNMYMVAPNANLGFPEPLNDAPDCNVIRRSRDYCIIYCT